MGTIAALLLAIDSGVTTVTGSIVASLSLVGGLIFGYLRFRREGPGEVVKQQAAVLADSLAVYSQMKEALEEARDDRAAARRDAEAARADASASRAAADRAQAEAEALRAEVGRATNEVAALREQVRILQRTLEEVRDR